MSSSFFIWMISLIYWTGWDSKLFNIVAGTMPSTPPKKFVLDVFIRNWLWRWPWPSCFPLMLEGSLGYYAEQVRHSREDKQQVIPASPTKLSTLRCRQMAWLGIWLILIILMMVVIMYITPWNHHGTKCILHQHTPNQMISCSGASDPSFLQFS